MYLANGYAFCVHYAEHEHALSLLALSPEHALGARCKAGSARRKSLYAASILILSIIYCVPCMLLSGGIIHKFFKLFIPNFSARRRRR